jgi:hypothetical protein
MCISRRFRWLLLVLAVLLGFGAAGVPAVAEAAGVQPAQVTHRADIQPLQTLMNNAFFLELAAKACTVEVTLPAIQSFCAQMQQTQTQQIANAQVALRVASGSAQWQPTLNQDDQQVIAYLLSGDLSDLSDQLIVFTSAIGDRYLRSLQTAATCARGNVGPLTRHYCLTLGGSARQMLTVVLGQLDQSFGSQLTALGG